MPVSLDEARRNEKRERIASIKDHPAWPDLVEQFMGFREQAEHNLGRRQMRGQKVDQSLIDREAGYWAGVRAVLRYPDRLQENVQFLREQGE